MSTPRRFLLLVLVLLLGACASATKRYEQGLELEMNGRYDEAGMRYVQALQKDPSLQEARSRLRFVSERAVGERLADAGSWSARGEAVTAASQYKQIDGIVARAHSVGVRLDMEPDYLAQRREAFGEATESLLRDGEAALDRGQWSQAAAAAHRAGHDFEPTLEQCDRALDVESSALVGWSHDELVSGHLQAAFARAERVQVLDGCPPERYAEAGKIMQTALAQGQVELMALPAVVLQTKTTRTRGGRGHGRDDDVLRAVEIDVNDALDRGPWRAVSPFVVLSDPIEVREIVRQAERLNGRLRAPALGLLLRLADADYGAWLEIVDVQETEFEVRQTERAVRTRDGKPATFLLEEGQRRLHVEARVIVVDPYGNQLTDLMVVGSATGPFREGIYDGNPAELNLGRRDVEAFDALALEAQDAALRRLMAEDLALKMGAAVLDPVMARIP